jgi:hypothetical protein
MAATTGHMAGGARAISFIPRYMLGFSVPLLSSVVRPRGCRDADMRQRCTSNPETMMRWAGEPKLEEVLSDPIVHAVMARDRVDQEGLRLLLGNTTKLLALRDGKGPDASAAFRQQEPKVVDDRTPGCRLRRPPSSRPSSSRDRDDDPRTLQT